MKKGIHFALLTAVISGISIFSSKLIVAGMDPVVFTTLKNIFVVALLFTLSFVMKSNIKAEIKKIKTNDWFKLILIGIIGGGIPFALFFTGLKIATAPGAALIHKTLFIWVAILAIPFLKEKLSQMQLVGYVAVLLGSVWLAGLNQFIQFGTGEIMITIATLLWAVENIIAKKALTTVSSELVAFMRMSVGAIVLLGIVIWQGNIQLMTQLSGTQYIAIVVAGILLTGYVLSWYKALSYAPATLVSSVLVLATPITSILTAAFISHSLPNTELLSSFLVLVGTGLIMYFATKPKDVTLAA